MNATKTLCAWCHPNAPHVPGQSHGICASHRDEMLRDLERNSTRYERELRRMHMQMVRPVRNTDLDAPPCGMMTPGFGTPWSTARDVAIGFLAGALVLGTAILAMLAL